MSKFDLPNPLPEKPGLKSALDALSAPRGPAQDWHRPPASTFPGPKAKSLPGQLDIFGADDGDDMPFGEWVERGCP